MTKKLAIKPMDAASRKVLDSFGMFQSDRPGRWCSGGLPDLRADQCVHTWVIFGKGEVCSSCGATCSRDERGKIEDYSVTSAEVTQ